MNFQLYTKTEQSIIEQKYQDKTRHVTIKKISLYDKCYHDYYYRIKYVVNGRLNHLSNESNHARAYTLYNGIVKMIS